MHDQLQNVQQIQASHGAFAATLGGGSVVTWGVLTMVAIAGLFRIL